MTEQWTLTPEQARAFVSEDRRRRPWTFGQGSPHLPARAKCCRDAVLGATHCSRCLQCPEHCQCQGGVQSATVDGFRPRTEVES